MTVSGSTNFESSGGQIIQDALLLCNGLEDDETATQEQEQHSLRVLNRMCKAWSAKGLKMWCWNQLTLTLADGQTSYTIDPAGAGDLTADKPLEIRNARKIYSSQETPIRITSRQEYSDLTGKDDDGEPVFIFFEPLISTSKIYVWQVPDASASSYSIKFDAKQYIEDFDSSTNTPYFPPEWEEALVYGLAWRLCPQYEIDAQTRLDMGVMAKDFLMEAEDSDMEQGSIFISPVMCG